MGKKIKIHGGVVCSILIYLFVFFVYADTSLFYKFNERNTFNYFSHLAYSLMHGYPGFITTPNTMSDLIEFNGRIYLFSPPSPALLVIPFIIIFGIGVSSSIYTLIIGAANPVILFWVIHCFSSLIKIKTSNTLAFLLVIFYSLGTSHLYESAIGRVWDTGQIFSQTYILLALLSFLLFELQLKNKYLYFLSFFLFLAGMGRTHFTLAVPAFLLLHYAIHKKKKLSNLVVPTVFTVIMFLKIYFWYNLIRFGSIFETGLIYHNANDFFKSDIAKYGLFSLHYIPVNLYVSFIKPFALNFNFPFIFSPDPVGNGILFSSPLLLLLFLYIRFKKYSRLKGVLLALLIGIIGIYLPSLAHFSTGWVQFGARYLLDPMPFIILLLIPVVAHVRIRYIFILTLLSIYIQYHAFLLSFI